MTKFLLLYEGGGMPESEEEQAIVLKAWENWYGKLGSAVVDPGNPVGPVSKITASGAVTDGQIGIMASGYTIIQADSPEEAVKFAKGCPILKDGGEVSVFQTFDAM